MTRVSGMGVVLAQHNVTLLKSADDLVLISTNVKVLQNGMDALYQYCISNKLTINEGKSKSKNETNLRDLPQVYICYNGQALE